MEISNNYLTASAYVDLCLCLCVSENNEHKRSVDKTNIQCKPSTVAEHFVSHPNHCHTDMQLIPLEIIQSSRDLIRKARESFLIDLGRTLEPHGMNRRDES